MASDESRPASRDRAIDEWLGAVPGDARDVLMGIDQLNGMALAVRRDQPAEVPDEVMTRWHSLLARQRRVADQSEPVFIEQARRQGWSWQRIADVLGLPDADAAERRRDVLAAELARTHPGNLPQPWLGWGKVASRPED
ncbi:hypothetical protein [Saccharothrix hoggarensis]|uniref:Uncharacterized protein n=1 Tax=Saccharothrix hoggarensis TaxID=913853 RepID=A0ABW3QR92_9PSEU